MRKIYSSGWPKHILMLGFMFSLILFCTELNAQTRRFTINGKVTDAKTKETLPGVAVRLVSTTSAVSTNIDGNYSLSANLSSGQYSVSFTYIGYKTITKTIQLGNDETITLNAELAQDAVGLDEVIITGTSEGTTRRQPLPQVFPFALPLRSRKIHSMELLLCNFASKTLNLISYGIACRKSDQAL